MFLYYLIILRISLAFALFWFAVKNKKLCFKKGIHQQFLFSKTHTQSNPPQLTQVALCFFAYIFKMIMKNRFPYFDFTGIFGDYNEMAFMNGILLIRLTAVIGNDVINVIIYLADCVIVSTTCKISIFDNKEQIT